MAPSRRGRLGRRRCTASACGGAALRSRPGTRCGETTRTPEGDAQVVNVQRHAKKNNTKHQKKPQKKPNTQKHDCLPSLCQCWSATNKSFPIMPLFTKSLPSLSCGISEGRSASSVNTLSPWGKTFLSLTAGRIFSRGRCRTFLGLVVKHLSLCGSSSRPASDVCDDDHDRLE